MFEPDLDRAIGAIADVQRGVITQTQLLACGLDSHGIKRRRDRTTLRSVFRGVYVVGHTELAPLARETAALLACAPDSLLSHRTALAVWGLRAARPEEPVEVTVLGHSCAARRGIVLHRSQALQRVDIGRRQRLPVTLPVRALLESAGQLDPHELERSIDEAIARELVSRPELLAVLDRYPGQRGAKLLRELTDPSRASAITRSRAENRMLRLLKAAQVPPPEVNAKLGPYEVDLLWREQRLVVEIDGWTFHRDRKRFENDNRRDAELRAAGFEVLRFTRRQVMFEPELVIFRLGRALAFSPLPAGRPAGGSSAARRPSSLAGSAVSVDSAAGRA